MSGNRSAMCNRATALKAARMASDGYTTRQIAEATGIAVERVKARVQLWQRLAQLVELNKVKP